MVNKKKNKNNNHTQNQAAENTADDFYNYIIFYQQ